MGDEDGRGSSTGGYAEVASCRGTGEVAWCMAEGTRRGRGIPEGSAKEHAVACGAMPWKLCEGMAGFGCGTEGGQRAARVVALAGKDV